MVDKDDRNVSPFLLALALIVLVDQNPYIMWFRIRCMQRRQLLVGVATSIPLLAGCLSGDGENTTETTTQPSAQTTTTQKTSTQTTTAQTTTAATTTTGTSSENAGTSSIDPSNLSVYTSDKYGYSVKVPTGWPHVDKGSSIKFSSDESLVLVQAVPKKEANTTRDKYMKSVLRTYQENATTFNASNERIIKLPNGNTGKAINLKFSNESVSYQGQAVFANGKQKIYLVVVLVPPSAYNSGTKKAVDMILKSLTFK